MKKIIYTTFLLCFIGTFAIAQPPQRQASRERIETMKIGYLTDRLNLTSEEAKNFWPVYNKYQNELQTLRRNRRNNLQDSIESQSDADLEKMVDGELAFRQSELDIMKKYLPQFKKILSVRKVALLYRSEEDFKRRLLDLIQDRKEERMDRRRR